MFFNLLVGIKADSEYRLFDTKISEFSFALKQLTADFDTLHNYSFVAINLQK
jgi:hypothetical protein